MMIKAWLARWRANWIKVESPDWRSAAAVLMGAVLLWPLVNQLPMLGYDWGEYFSRHNFDHYPQWAEWALAPLLALPWRLALALLNSMLLMTVAVSVAREVYRRADRITWGVTSEALGTALLALCTPPVFILLWVGNIEGLALFGMLIMPVGVVWLSLKPHLGVWAILSRRSWVVWSAVFIALTLLIWPGWPFKLVNSLNDRLHHPSAFGWASLGWPMIVVGIVLLVMTPAEALPLMAAGSFLSPFLMPQHFVLFLPALGRVRGVRRLLLWAASWLVAVPILLGGWIKVLALGFPLLVWWMLRNPTDIQPPATQATP